jgi:hypothetical protein
LTGKLTCTKWNRYEDISTSRQGIPEKASHDVQVLLENRKPEDDYEVFLGPRIINHWTTKEKLESLFRAKLDPQVMMAGTESAIVKLLIFTTQGGFQYLQSWIRYPNLIRRGEVETVLEYHANPLE